MPVHETEDGKYQYGKTGKVYKNKKDAIKQAIAIAYSKAKEKGRKPTQKEISAEITGKEKMINKSADAKADKEKFTTTLINDIASSDPSDIYPSAGRYDLTPLMKLLADTRFNHTSGGGRDLRTTVDYMLENVHNKRTNAGKANSFELSKKKLESHRADMQEEFDKDTNFKEALMLRAPSYLAFSLAGAAVGRLLAGRKYKWWGYGLGGLLGAGANFARRKSYYGGVKF